MIYDYKITTGKGETLDLSDYKGNVVARFEPTADMAEVEACVKALL